MSKSKHQQSDQPNAPLLYTPLPHDDPWLCDDPSSHQNSQDRSPHTPQLNQMEFHTPTTTRPSIDPASSSNSSTASTSASSPMDRSSAARLPMIHYVCRPLRLAKNNEPTVITAPLVPVDQPVDTRLNRCDDDGGYALYVRFDGYNCHYIFRTLQTDQICPCGFCSNPCSSSPSIWHPTALLTDGDFLDQSSLWSDKMSHLDHNLNDYFKYPMPSLCSSCLRSLLFLPGSKLTPLSNSSNSPSSDAPHYCCVRSRSHQSLLQDPFSHGALLGGHIAFKPSTGSPNINFSSSESNDTSSDLVLSSNQTEQLTDHDLLQ